MIPLGRLIVARRWRHIRLEKMVWLIGYPAMEGAATRCRLGRIAGWHMMLD